MDTLPLPGPDLVVRRSPRPSTAASLTAVGAIAGALATVPLVVLAHRRGTDGQVGEWLVGTFTPGFVLAGWWLSARRPGSWIARLYLVAGASTAVAGLAAAYVAARLPTDGAGLAWALWVFSWLWLVHGAAMSVVMVLFPRRGPRGRLDRALIGLTVTTTAVSMLVASVRPGIIVTTPDHPDGAPAGLVNPLGIDALGPLAEAVVTITNVVGIATSLFVVGLLIARWRRAPESLERRQYRWVLLLSIGWLVVIPLILAVPGELGPVLAIAATLAFQLLIVVAILRWDVYDARVVIRRSTLAGALLAGALVIYGAVVLVAAVAVGGFGPVPATVGALVTTFAFGPLSPWIRRRVDRLFYGRRDDPYAVLAAIARSHAVATDPDDAMARLVRSIAELLRLPAVAVLDRDGGTIAHHGTMPGGPVDDIDLHHLAVRHGVLRLAPRTGTDGLTPDERVLARSLGDALAAAVAARHVASELRVANDGLVVARDAERARYQRDLHDGLGPRLTSVVFRLDALGHLLDAGRVDDAARVASEARDELVRGVDDVRAYIHSLGATDPAPDLRRSLVDHLRRLTAASTIELDVDIDLELDGARAVPAATGQEIHAVAAEAVTNVLRHAAARRCRVALRLDRSPGDHHGPPGETAEARGDALVLEVSDDGQGFRDAWQPGVGLASMRHRIEQLGGAFLVEHRSPGTTVRCTIPVPGR